MLHAHFGSESRDCDGRYNDGRDIDAAKFGDGFTDKRYFAEALLTWLYRSPDVGPVHIDIDNADNNRLIIMLSMSTDEGFYSSSVLICEEDDFDAEYSGYRDHTAESMGY